MRFETISSPHLHSNASVAKVMQQVLLAMVPGIAATIYFFGWGTLINLVLAIGFALIFEAVMLKMRGRPIKPFLGDWSAVLTAVLLVMAMPQLSPWWMTCIGIFTAIVIAKHLYGGLGYNPFNPAMVGFVVLIISFPLEMTSWLPPTMLAEHALSFGDALRAIFLNQYPGELGVDAFTMATPLDHMKTALSLDNTVASILIEPIFGSIGGTGWEWIFIAYLIGGLYLILRGIIGWQIPLSMIGAIAVMAGLFHLIDASAYPAPWFHVFGGATILGAFFIATDPVTACTTPRGRIIFGIGVGVITYLIRTWGGFPDGVAFAVLLMNMAAPMIDYYTQPRVFGQQKG